MYGCYDKFVSGRYVGSISLDDGRMLIEKHFKSARKTSRGFIIGAASYVECVEG